MLLIASALILKSWPRILAMSSISFAFATHGRLLYIFFNRYISTTLSISIYSKPMSFALEEECAMTLRTGIVVFCRNKAIVETSDHVLKVGSTGKETRIRYDALFEVIE